MGLIEIEGVMEETILEQPGVWGRSVMGSTMSVSFPASPSSAASLFIQGQMSNKCTWSQWGLNPCCPLISLLLTY